jgi:hypothetical protein
LVSVYIHVAGVGFGGPHNTPYPHSGTNGTRWSSDVIKRESREATCERRRMPEKRPSTRCEASVKPGQWLSATLTKEPLLDEWVVAIDGDGDHRRPHDVRMIRPTADTDQAVFAEVVNEGFRPEPSAAHSRPIRLYRVEEYKCGQVIWSGKIEAPSPHEALQELLPEAFAAGWEYVDLGHGDGELQDPGDLTHSYAAEET